MMPVKIRVNIHLDKVLEHSIINESICCLQYIALRVMKSEYQNDVI